MPLTSDELLVEKEWNNIISSNVRNALGAKLDGKFTAVNYPAGFNYAMKQQYFNADSLSALNSLVTSTDDIPSFGAPFSSLYLNVIKNLEYSFSSEDQALMNQEVTDHSALVGKIIDEYQQSDLDTTPEKYPNVIYIIKRIKEVTGTDYLHVNIKEYPDLSDLCHSLSEYARLGVYTTKMENAWNAADDRMNAIAEHIMNPSDSNGGLKTDGNTFCIGWNQIPETEQLLKSLQEGSSISFSFSAANFHDQISTLHFTSGVTARLLFSWILGITVDHKHEYNLSTFAREESELTFTVTYKGISILAAIPAPLSDNNEKGWFASDILNEAALKSGKDATGYKLHGNNYKPSELFGKNGQLRRLKTFVLSQQPEISLSFKSFECTELQKLFTQSTDVSFHMLGGLIKGEHNNDYSFSEYNYNEQEQTLNVKIVPTPIGNAGSIGKQTAFVLGGVIESYGDIE